MKRRVWKGMSARVRERRQQRFRLRVRLALLMTAMAFLLAMTGLEAYTGWKRVRLAEAASWTGFKMTGDDIGGAGTRELIAGQWSDGVPILLTINGEQWEVVQVNHFNDSTREKPGSIQAMTNCEHRTISYITAQNPQALRINLMHEVFHAGDCLHGGDAWWNSEKPSGEDHPGVYHLGEFTATFLHDNPAFAVWEAGQ